jgi:hypothetical protein
MQWCTLTNQKDYSQSKLAGLFSQLVELGGASVLNK